MHTCAHMYTHNRIDDIYEHKTKFQINFFQIEIYAVNQKSFGRELLDQRSCGCPLPGSVWGQAEWDSEQPGLIKDVPTRGGGWNLMIFEIPFNPSHLMMLWTLC